MPDNNSLLKIMQDKIKSIEQKIDELPTKTEMELANEKLLKQVLEEVKKDFVSKDEFSPIRNLVYGVAGAVGLAIITAVISLIIR